MTVSYTHLDVYKRQQYVRYYNRISKNNTVVWYNTGKFVNGGYNDNDQRLKTMDNVCVVRNTGLIRRVG